jgi:dihydroneopterin aldolase
MTFFIWFFANIEIIFFLKIIFYYFYRLINAKMEIMIKLESMKFYAHHGVYPQETKVGQYFTVDVSYSFPLKEAFLTDDLNDTINYADVYDVVKSEMECPSKLLEHVTGRILRALKSRFPQLSFLRIKLSKLNPPLGGEVHSASVVLEDTW